MKLEICQKIEFLESFRITLASFPGGANDPKSKTTKTPECLPDLNPRMTIDTELLVSWMNLVARMRPLLIVHIQVVVMWWKISGCYDQMWWNHPAETGSCGTGAGSQVKQSGKLGRLTGQLTDV